MTAGQAESNLGSEAHVQESIVLPRGGMVVYLIDEMSGQAHSTISADKDLILPLHLDLAFSALQLPLSGKHALGFTRAVEQA